MRVAVIDSGWDRSIRDVRVVAGIAFVGKGARLDIEKSLDDQDLVGHGTATTSILLRVAPTVTIVPVRVFGSRLETSTDILVSALDWVVAQGITLANLSLGTIRGDAVRPLYSACARAHHAGTIIVAAGANEASEWSYPAVFDSVIGVGAGEVPGMYDIMFRPGAALECGVNPGLRHALGLGGSHKTVNGNSYGAPVVTGHVANILEGHSGLSTESVREELCKRAVRIVE